MPFTEHIRQIGTQFVYHTCINNYIYYISLYIHIYCNYIIIIIYIYISHSCPVASSMHGLVHSFTSEKSSFSG